MSRLVANLGIKSSDMREVRIEKIALKGRSLGIVTETAGEEFGFECSEISKEENLVGVKLLPSHI